VGQVQIYSRLDQEAHKALQDYRISIGLPAVAEFQRPPKIIQIGEWVDALAYQQLGKPWEAAHNPKPSLDSTSCPVAQ
jgi:hypothetical protein